MPNDIVFLALDQVLLAALSGAAVGAAAGGLAGALIGMGIPEIEAKAYEGKIKDGSILVSVHTEDSKEGDPKARASAPGARASAPNPASSGISSKVQRSGVTA